MEEGPDAQTSRPPHARGVLVAYANNNNEALATNSDAVAYAVLRFAMNLSDIEAVKSKGNFKDIRPIPTPGAAVFGHVLPTE